MKMILRPALWLILALFVSSVSFAQPKGQDIIIGQSYALTSNILEEERPYQVYLPDDYKKNGDPLAVMYLLDGDGHFHHTTGIISFLKNQGRIPNMMVVAIPNTSDRTRDLTPPIEVDMKAAENMSTAGGADNMLAFLKNELIPHINQSYNTAPYKILTGHSFGGLFAVHTLLSEPDLFDAYISISPSMWWDAQNLVAKADTFLSSKHNLDCFFYMTMGNEGGTMLGGAMKLAALFEEMETSDFKWDFKVMDDETHGSIPHRSTYYGLEAIFKDWFSIDYQKLYAGGGLENIKNHFDDISNKLGYQMRPSESALNSLGYALMGNDKIDDALIVFLENIELFPKSSNVYDSAGEAYMNNEENDKAIKYYKKSMLLNPGNTNGVEMLKKLGVTYNPEELEVKLNTEEQKKFVGDYEVSAGGVMTISIENKKLIAKHPAIPAQTMLYYSNNVFLLSPQNAPMKFSTDDKNNPTDFQVEMGIGNTITGKKKKPVE
jgi:predicted alpha/beta superfamily hydrolase